MKHTLYSMSDALGINRFCAYAHRRAPLVLTFHGVTDDVAPNFCNQEGLHLHAPIFTRIMEYLVRRYRPVPLARVVDWLAGVGQVPERAVVVTFDDGFRNVLTTAAPVLKRLGIPATLYVATDFVFERAMLWPDRLVSAFALTREKQITVPIADREVVLVLTDDARKQAAVTRVRAALKALPQAQRVQALETVLAQLNVAHDRLWSAWDGLRPLEPAELKRLPEAGIEVGSHTCSHPIVSRLNAADMERELRESRRTLEGAVGRACTQFAYPNGGPDDFDATTGAAVRAAGYTSAVTTIKRRVARTDGCFEIPRCTLTHNALTMTEFAAEASGFAGMLRAARDRRAGSRRGDAALRVSAHPNPRTEPR